MELTSKQLRHSLPHHSLYPMAASKGVAWLGEAMMVERDRTHAVNAAAIQAAASNFELDPLTNRVREFRENALLGDVWLLELGLH
ncbi:hypothetical protein [Bradyrhizobium sp. CCBAU 51753]|uniref:hypothetical protein n=1 Tax=Bradyrhizobium sp. CCBAU 51753 TaxID=1325100 RepID=UPI00188D9919|nr:hypothetical protein [Bradyrhizobium sp. CCBAU 51753]